MTVQEAINTLNNMPANATIYIKIEGMGLDIAIDIEQDEDGNVVITG